MNKKPHSIQTRNKAIALYKSGLSIDAVGEKIGCGKSSVYRWCEGLIRRQDMIRREKGRSLYLSGLSDSKVSKIIGVSRATIDNWCKGVMRPKGESMRGENNPAWKGGISPLVDKIRESVAYYKWRSACRKRDKNRCQIGGKSHGDRLHVHHLKPFYKIMAEHCINTFEKAMACEELWDIKNGKTLCTSCHEMTDTFYGRSRGYKGQFINFNKITT